MQIEPDRRRVAEFCERWGISELSLFGSVLRDDFRPDSDVDVLVSFAPETDWDYWNWPQMQDELRVIFGRDVDLVVKESLANPIRRQRILSTREAVYAA